MSHFLDRLTHFNLPKEPFAGGHGQVTNEDRTWEDAYRNRWAHDKIVRSTHGVNCTGCLLYTSPSPRDTERSRMPSSA